MATADAGQQRTKGVNFRATPNEFDRIEVAVGSRNRSEVLRRVVLQWVRRNENGEPENADD